MNKKKLYVTKPSLPPLDEFINCLEKIWDSRILTNFGPYHHELERKLKKYLGVKNVLLFNNATIALIATLKALNIKGEVITTPFTFIATANSIIWANCTPVFIDIDPTNFNLDPELIEQAITKKTIAILPVHCFSRPCDTKKIQDIAGKYNLKVIYDAAHMFNKPSFENNIYNYGDAAILSFHATKVFNTFEGGAVISNDENIINSIRKIRNFGFVSEDDVEEVGVNGKMNEIQAALGVLQLKYLNKSIGKRKKIDFLYRKYLKGVVGIEIPVVPLDTEYNYSYFPVIVKKEYSLTRDDLYKYLRAHNVIVRRYFYPLISDTFAYKKLKLKKNNATKNAEYISKHILCLPIHQDLSDSSVRYITSLINR